MSIKDTFKRIAADLRAKHAAAVSYRRSYKVMNAAIRVGDADAVRTLLDDGVVDINKPPRGTPPAIAVAVKENRNAVFSMLMGAGADPNTTLRESGFGYIQETPLLSLAIINHNTHAARELLAHPWIDPTRSGHLTATGSIHGGAGYAQRETPLQLAKREGMDDIAALIENHPAIRNTREKVTPRAPSPAPQH